MAASRQCDVKDVPRTERLVVALLERNIFKNCTSMVDFRSLDSADVMREVRMAAPVGWRLRCDDTVARRRKPSLAASER